MQFDNLTSRGYKPKINIMDNQATKHIEAFLTKQQCQLQLAKPHNHQLNAAKRAIQTFKDVYCNCGTELLHKCKILST